MFSTGLEAQIEKYICDHPHVLEDCGWGGVRVIGRQLTTTHGRLDILLGFDGPPVTLAVVELKARPIYESDIGQVLRYKHDITEYLAAWAHSHYMDRIYSEECYDAHVQDNLSTYVFDESSVDCVLVGSDINDKAAAACDAAGVIVYLWQMTKSCAVSFDRYWGYSDREIIPPAWMDLASKSFVTFAEKEARRQMNAVVKHRRQFRRTQEDSTPF